jgi:hypothetical protein
VTKERRLLQPLIDAFKILKGFDKATPIWVIPLVPCVLIRCCLDSC